MWFSGDYNRFSIETAALLPRRFIIVGQQGGLKFDAVLLVNIKAAPSEKIPHLQMLSNLQLELLIFVLTLLKNIERSEFAINI